MAIIIRLSELEKRYDHKHKLLDGVNLEVPDNDFHIIFGMPGCGKSVLMRIIMGLENPTSGTVELRGRNTWGVDPGEHNIGYVPQSFALFPHQTVYQNIAYPLFIQKRPKDEIKTEVLRVAKMLSIEDLLEKKPGQTSGGQKQRIAIARGLVKRTDIYIFDDPFVGLDFKLREQLVYDLRNLQQMLGVTFVYTTSDSMEALQLAKTISILHNGQILETNNPFQLYMQPQHTDSMRILGFPNANMITGNITQGRLQAGPFDISDTGLKDGLVVVGIRPENVVLSTQINMDAYCFHGTVRLREDLGGEEILYCETDDGVILRMMLWHQSENEDDLPLGKRIEICVDKQAILYFDANSGQRL